MFLQVLLIMFQAKEMVLKLNESYELKNRSLPSWNECRGCRFKRTDVMMRIFPVIKWIMIRVL